jgi:hypothetical protein
VPNFGPTFMIGVLLRRWRARAAARMAQVGLATNAACTRRYGDAHAVPRPKALI